MELVTVFALSADADQVVLLRAGGVEILRFSALFVRPFRDRCDRGFLRVVFGYYWLVTDCHLHTLESMDSFI